MPPRNRVAVVVLGDIGRSPRMQYHALSLARQGLLEVDIVAYGGSDPHTLLLENKSIHIHKMPQGPTVPQTFPKILRPLILILKPIIQFLVLMWYLCIKIPAPDAFIVQNPPSVPTLVVVKWASWLRHSTFIVDWHNFGYTLLALSLGRSSYFVAVYRWISNSLNQPYGFRDCIVSGEGGSAGSDSNYPNTNPFTTQIDSDISLKENRPALIVSSTSWTPDEDFSILLEAAVMYDRRVAALLHEDDSIGDETVWEEMHSGKRFTYPRLLFVITGKGPEKEKYEKKLKKLSLKRVAFRTMWLSAEDYALLLGSADLGVCLHTSSSGLDLPMKVVDMFGCGLPVCAVSYSCIKELVETGKNGRLFSSSSELADELMMLFEGFPDRCDALQSMRTSLMERTSSSRWATEWEENARPLIHQVISENSS